ncbi:MAG: NAD(P)H-binding protein [Kordiimonadaceae bacterium]|nr:NAD(P)H-binding protein [Kordiimonadaceae bacterium]MBO6569513.1 NAD(P)H-binding protein [Kordiimonadaceae bacterium]MBO6964988.1 NAD(P)H-binding protein [Kordiimonadaceae bacterium]
MAGKVLVLGANGRFGRAATNAFLDGGWQVSAMVRNAATTDLPHGLTIIEGDAMDEASVVRAASDMDVIVNALNPAYGDWEDTVPTFTRNVIAAAEASGASILIAGNVYVFGEDMPSLLTSITAHKPSNAWGRVREDLEHAYRDASHRGVQTILLRAGDFFEGKDTGNWFESQMANKLCKGVFTYPGPTDRMHAWAYLPDLGRAAEMLARNRRDLGAFEDIGFEGYSLTGAELTKELEALTGKPLKVKIMPWWAIRLLANFNSNMRGVAAMSYLWRVPHRLDGSKLAALLPDFQPTPLEGALRAATS